MHGRDVWNDQDDFTTNVKRSIQNIINASKALSYQSREFKFNFDALCHGRNPETWTPIDMQLIMQSYQLIFQTLSKLNHQDVPAWKIPGYTHGAMWYYDNITDHQSASVEYYLAACAVCIHYAVERISRSTPAAIHQENNIDKFAASAVKAATIASRVEELLFNSSDATEMLATHQRKLAQCYRDISLIFQAVADYDMALHYADAAIRTFSNLGEQDKSSLFGMSETYRELAITFKFNDFHHELFSLMSDYFRGSKRLNFARLAQLEFNCKNQPQHKDIFAQCLCVIDDFHKHDLLPMSPLKNQLQNDYFHQRFTRLLELYQTERLESSIAKLFDPSPILGRNSLFGASLNGEDVDLAFIEEVKSQEEQEMVTVNQQQEEANDASDSDPELFIPIQFESPPTSPRLN